MPVVVVKGSFVQCLPSVCVCVCVDWRRYSKGGVGGGCDVGRVVAFSCWV